MLKHPSVATAGQRPASIYRVYLFSAGQRPRWLVLFALLWLTAALAGCQTYKYLPPDGQLIGQVAPPVELASYTGTAEGWREAQAWFAGPGDDYTLKINTRVDRTTGGMTFWRYLLTLSLWPYVETNYKTATAELWSGEQMLFRNEESYAMREALSVYFPTALFYGSQGNQQQYLGASDLLNRHALALGQYIASGRGAYEKDVAAGTTTVLHRYLEAHPVSFFRRDALQRLAALAPARQPLAFHQDNVARYGEAYQALIPAEHALWFIGPADMTVRDLLAKQRSQSTELLASRIRAAGKPYKVFNDSEIKILQQGGIKAGVIAAMIDVSANQAAGTPAASPASPAASALGGMLIQQQQAAPATTAPAATPAAPGAGEIAADCAKRLVAMKACDQVPSLGRSICKATVRKQYNHIACDLIQ